MTRGICIALVCAAGATLGCGAAEPGEPTMEMSRDAYAAAVQAWRDTHEADYLRDYVSIAGLHFLREGVRTVGAGAGNDIVLTADVPPTIGTLTVEGTAVQFQPAPGVDVRQGGKPIAGPLTLKAAGQPPAEEVTVGAVRLVVHVSGDRLSLRIRDPNGAPAREFQGFRWFPIDERYVVTGRFLPDEEPRELSVVNTLGDVDRYATEGVVEFEFQGQPLRLRPFTTRPNRFYFVFRDGSSGVETYETARFLYADLRADGTTVLDFNQAYNPPCAFNPYTTCPIPLAENILPATILAGERAYGAEAAVGRPN